jgi:broad specificity phosphatase PhoE
MNIFIARHGQTEWNLIRRIQGQTNTQLSAAGLQQGLDLCQLLKEQPIHRIYTSSLDRTILTAQPLAEHLGITIQSTKLLNELAFGVLEGQYLLDLDDEGRNIWDWWMEDQAQRCIPGGESYTDLRKRAETFVDENLNEMDQTTVLIVGHYRINQMLLGCLLDIPVSQAISIEQKNTWLYHFRPGKLVEGTEITSQEFEEILWISGLVVSGQ